MYFTDNDGKTSFLSPFSKHPIILNGTKYNTVAHYYTCNKFYSSDPSWAACVLRANTIKTLTQMSNSRTHKIASNWDSNKYSIMEKAYRLKFEQHTSLKKQLINLNVKTLIYNCGSRFKYWRQHLGPLLMKLKLEYTPVIKKIPCNTLQHVLPKVDNIIEVSLIKNPAIVKENIEKNDILCNVSVPVLPTALAKPDKPKSKHIKVLHTRSEKSSICDIDTKPELKRAQSFSINSKTTDFFKPKSNVTQEEVNTKELNKVDLEFKKIHNKTEEVIIQPPVKSNNSWLNAVVKKDKLKPKVKEETKVEPEVKVKEETKVEPEVKVKEETKVEPEVKVKEETKVEPSNEKDLLVISLDSPDNKITNSICIPLSTQKNLTGCEIDDEVLIQISKKISILNSTKKIVLNDNTNWYNNIIQNLSLAIAGKNFAFKTGPGIYVQGILDRHPDLKSINK
jgi:ribA/ribD-fused uncharacterized protein